MIQTGWNLNENDKNIYLENNGNYFLQSDINY